MRGPHWLALFGAVLLAWAALIAMAVPAGDSYARALVETLCAPSGGFWSTLTMWALMSGAMMAPTALPAFATYEDLGSQTATRFGHLVAGYLLIWLGFAVLAALGQTVLTRAGLLDTLGTSRVPPFSAALLVGAGLYQFSTLKEACLSRCRAPLTFFMQNWDEGPFRNGLRLGMDCLGCCWALMALAWVGGVMNLGFMALAMVLMLLEKLPELGRRITKPLGVVLIASGAITAFM